MPPPRELGRRRRCNAAVRATTYRLYRVRRGWASLRLLRGGRVFCAPPQLLGRIAPAATTTPGSDRPDPALRCRPTTRGQFSSTDGCDWRASRSELRAPSTINIWRETTTTTKTTTTSLLNYNKILKSLFAGKL